mgnify:CR=1 FL=1
MKKEYRDVLWKFIDAGIAPTMRDSVCLLNEVERLTTELDAVDSDLQLAVKRLTAEVQRLTAYAEAHGHTLAELALSWVAGIPVVAAVKIVDSAHCRHPAPDDLYATLTAEKRRTSTGWQ